MPDYKGWVWDSLTKSYRFENLNDWNKPKSTEQTNSEKEKDSSVLQSQSDRRTS